MAGSKGISALTAAAALDGTELVHILQGGNSRKATSAALAAAASGAVSNLFTAGWYYGPGGGRSALALTQNQLNYVPFWVGEAVTLDRIGCEVTTLAAASVVRLGIYGDTGGGLPGALLLEAAGTIDAGVGGAAELTISQALTPGLHWLAAVAQGGTPALRVVTGALVPGPGNTLGATTGSSAPAGVYQTGVTGALPATAAPASRAILPPLVVVRAA